METEARQTQSMMDQMRDVDPKRNPLYTAIDQLQDAGDIKQFLAEYIEELGKSEDQSVREDPLEVTRANLAWIKGEYGDSSLVGNWMDVFSGMAIGELQELRREVRNSYK